MEVRGLQWPSMWMDLFWCKCACCHYLSLAISRLLPEDGYCYCYWVEDNHNVLMKTSLLSNTCFSLTLSFCYSWHAISTKVMPMLLMLMVVLSTRCSQQWFQSERTGPSLHSWGIPAMNITCQSACTSYPNLIGTIMQINWQWSHGRFDLISLTVYHWWLYKSN